MLPFEEYRALILDLLDVEVCESDKRNYTKQVTQVEMYARNIPMGNEDCLCQEIDNEQVIKEAIALGVYQILEVEEADDGYQFIVFNYLRLKDVIKV